MTLSSSSSSTDIFEMFENESQKLKDLISSTDVSSGLSISEIVETYHKVISVSSIISVIKQQQHPSSEQLLEKIQKTQAMISEKFDSCMHPEILKHLSDSVKRATWDLQSENSAEKSVEQTRQDAKLFEELREIMSTLEFAKQYDRGLAK